MIFREQKANLLVFKGSLLHYPEDVFPKLNPSVVFTDLDLDYFALTHDSS